MDDGLPTSLVQPLLQSVKMKQWQAKLELGFKHENGRSYLAHKKHVGPLLIQKTLHPEGTALCHGIIVHPPGGVASGDQLTLCVDVENSANVLLTTPGAGKWYKTTGHEAQQTLNFQVKDQACLEWLPQENILFEAANVRWKTQVELQENAKFASWEVTCFGRQAQKEAWVTGGLHQNVAIKRDGRLIWQECLHAHGASQVMRSIVGMNGLPVNASFVVAAGAVPQKIIEACRALTANMALDLQAKKAVTVLPEVFVARYVGASAQHARHYFETLWQVLRPWYLGVEANKPRIWNT